jgi:hypothetical protein
MKKYCFLFFCLPIMATAQVVSKDSTMQHYLSIGIPLGINMGGSKITYGVSGMFVGGGELHYHFKQRFVAIDLCGTSFKDKEYPNTKVGLFSTRAVHTAVSLTILTGYQWRSKNSVKPVVIDFAAGLGGLEYTRPIFGRKTGYFGGPFVAEWQTNYTVCASSSVKIHLNRSNRYRFHLSAKAYMSSSANFVTLQFGFARIFAIERKRKKRNLNPSD